MPVNAMEVIRVSCRFKNSFSGDIVNVYHWRADGAGAPFTDSEIKTAIEGKLSEMYAYISPMMMAITDPYDIRYDIVEWSNNKETVVRTLGTDTWTLTTPPSGSGESLPQMDAGVINLRTLTPKTFGRKYLGPISEGHGASGSLTSIAVGLLADYAAALLSTITFGAPGTLSPGIMSYKEIAGINFKQITAAVVNAVIGSQRRRRINRGS